MKMIFMLTIWIPPDKGKEAMEKSMKIISAGMPKFIKKWQIYTTNDGLNGTKAYELIFTEKGRADEALLEISKVIVPLAEIEGTRYKLETLFGMKDTIATLQP
ncbi:MAG: hypothetical protein HWN67_02850 [Candidatus Helarchaeota archaeon]|nr:hypothetical protein [Candidatus Helarchaeota archaeon]